MSATHTSQFTILTQAQRAVMDRIVKAITNFEEQSMRRPEYVLVGMKEWGTVITGRGFNKLEVHDIPVHADPEVWSMCTAVLS